MTSVGLIIGPRSFETRRRDDNILAKPMTKIISLNTTECAPAQTIIACWVDSGAEAYQCWPPGKPALLLGADLGIAVGGKGLGRQRSQRLTIHGEKARHRLVFFIMAACPMMLAPRQ